MPTFVIRNGKLLNKQYAPPLIEILGEAPFVISDTMSETRHMADGHYYTSKAAFRKATRAAGCVEVGNETTSLVKPRKRVTFDRRKRRDDIKRAISELKSK